MSKAKRRSLLDLPEIYTDLIVETHEMPVETLDSMIGPAKRLSIVGAVKPGEWLLARFLPVGVGYLFMGARVRESGAESNRAPEKTDDAQ